jgi:O-succinylbenzoic acid--CoA ligase
LASEIPHRFFIVGQPDDTWGEKVVLVIEANPYTVPTTLFDSLTKFEKPKAIVFQSTFQETDSGKIIRKLSV